LFNPLLHRIWQRNIHSSHSAYLRINNMANFANKRGRFQAERFCSNVLGGNG
jgi:hypothetical protein